MRKRNNVIRTRLDDHELARFLTSVHKTELTKSEYLRLLINNKIPIEAPPADYITLLRQLSYVGANVNRILRNQERFGNTDTVKLYEALSEIEQCKDAMINAFMPKEEPP